MNASVVIIQDVIRDDDDEGCELTHMMKCLWLQGVYFEYFNLFPLLQRHTATLCFYFEDWVTKPEILCWYTTQDFYLKTLFALSDCCTVLWPDSAAKLCETNETAAAQQWRQCPVSWALSGWTAGQFWYFCVFFCCWLMFGRTEYRQTFLLDPGLFLSLVTFIASTPAEFTCSS